MKILIKPSDIIERALWYKYEYYILDDKKKEKIKETIDKNEEFELSEKDALIIGLLSCIETDNLKHRLNQHLLHLYSIRSTDFSDDKGTYNVISKNLIEGELDRYMKNFPDEWNPTLNYVEGIKELRKYIKELTESIKDLIIHEGDFQGNKVEYIQINHLKKIMDFNHG